MNPNHDTLPTAVCEAVAQLRAESPVSASDALLARIQRSRAKGARVFLPLSDAPVVEDAPSLRWWRGGMVAAGLAAMVIIAVARPRPSALTTHGASTAAGSPNAAPTESASTGDASGNATSPVSPLAELLAPWPRVAYAQTPAGGRAGPFAALSGLQADRVKLGRRVYVRLSGNAYHDLLPHQTYELDVDTARYEGKSVLRLVTTQDISKWMPKEKPSAPSLINYDTVWLDRARLLPIARHSVKGPLEVTQRFADTVLQQRTMMDTRKMGLKNPPKPVVTNDRLRIDPSRPLVVSEAVLRVLLQSTTLFANWKGSVGVMAEEPVTIATLEGAYRNLRVVGLDTLQTFSGRFPVWRVEVDNGRFPEMWYVSQETGEVLLTSGPWNGRTYPRSESHLIGGFSETKRLPPVKSVPKPSGQPQ